MQRLVSRLDLSRNARILMLGDEAVQIFIR